MKKVLAVLLAGMFVLGFGVGCGGSDVSEEVTVDGWYAAFENTFHALCDGQFYNDGNARRGKFPENSNCKLTCSDERAQLGGEVVIDGDTAYLKVSLKGASAEAYIWKNEDGTLAVYALDVDGDRSSSMIENEQWEQQFFRSSPLFGDWNQLLQKGYNFDYQYVNGGTLNEELWETAFVFDEGRGGYLEKLSSGGYGNYREAVYKIHDGKLSSVILTGDSSALMMGDEKGDGCKAVFTMVYGGQKITLPPEVIEAANQQQSAKTDYTDEEWFEIFKFAATSMCDVDYAAGDPSSPYGWASLGSIPNDKNCRVTLTGPNGNLLAQVIVAEGKAYAEQYPGDGDDEDRPRIYLQNAGEGLMTGYQSGLGEGWGPVSIPAEEFARCESYGCVYGTEFLLTVGQLGNGLRAPDGKEYPSYREFFEYSEQKGGWVSKSEAAVALATNGMLDGEVVFYIKGGKLTQIVLTGICPELMLETPGSIVYTFTYGGQNADVPPEVIEAANQKQNAKTDYTDEEWFEIFKFAATSMCDVDYAAGDPSSPYGWASLGSIPNDKNCEVTLTGPNGNLLAQVIVAEGKAYGEISLDDGADSLIYYLENAENGKLTGYQSGLGEGWGSVTMNAEEFAQSCCYGYVYGTEFLLTVGQLGNGLRAPDGKEYPSYREFFEYDEQKGGWVSKSEAAVALATNGMLDGEVVFYIKGGKLTQIVLTGICPELMLETPGSIIYAFTYGGQNADVPPEVIEAANQ